MAVVLLVLLELLLAGIYSLFYCISMSARLGIAFCGCELDTSITAIATMHTKSMSLQ